MTWTAEEYQERTGLLLLPQHLEQLHASAISLEVAAGRSYRSATTRRELKALGFSLSQQEVIREASRSDDPAAALVVPLWWTDPTAPILHQVRPDSPRCAIGSGKAIKYETPAKAGCKLDVHPSMRESLGAADVPLLVTEGAKKGDAAATAGLCCVSLLGVNSWRGRNPQGGLTALAEWNDVHLKGRTLYLVFDSDVMTKEPVYLALLSLRAWLASKGADILVVYLPSGDLGAKVGLDDFLATGATRDDLLALATRQFRHPDNVKPDFEGWEVGSYRMDENGTWMRRKEDEYRLLADFAAYIEFKIVEDDDDSDRERDGEELKERQHFNLLIRQGKRTVRHEVTASGFHAMRWTAEVAALDLIVTAGASTRDFLREAIELVSKEVANKQGQQVIARRTVFAHTGWRQASGRSVYLQSDGGVGPEGTVSDVEVRLDSVMRDYRVPDPPNGADLIDAVRASLALTDLGPDLIIIPALASVYRAPLGPANFAMHSTGGSDRFKTELAALLQQHFGEAWNGEHLPLGWSATGNAIELVLHQAKDAFVVCDDFLPAGLPPSERDAQLRAAARVFRAQGNRQGRGRLTRDITLRAPLNPRGLLYSTGEEIPPGLSQVARVWVITPGKNDITVERLSAAQARSHLYSRAMAGYLRWLAPRIGGIAAEMRTRLAELRLVYPATHRRTSGIAANLEIGWTYFLAFARECSAITQHEHDELLVRARVALLRGASAQAGHQHDSNPVQKFVSGLQAALAAGAVHVAGPLGKLPDQPGSWGWRQRTLSLVGDDADRWEPRGDRVGWVDGKELYLVPEAAYKAATAMHRDGLGVDLKALGALLQDAGHLVRSDGERRQTVKAPLTVDVARTRVWCMQADLSSGSRASITSPDVLHLVPLPAAPETVWKPCPDEPAPICPDEDASIGAEFTVISDTMPSSNQGHCGVKNESCPDCPDCPDHFAGVHVDVREHGASAISTSPEPVGVLCRAPGCGGLAWRWDSAVAEWRCRKCDGPLPPWLLKAGA